MDILIYGNRLCCFLPLQDVGGSHRSQIKDKILVQRLDFMDLILVLICFWFLICACSSNKQRRLKVIHFYLSYRSSLLAQYVGKPHKTDVSLSIRPTVRMQVKIVLPQALCTQAGRIRSIISIHTYMDLSPLTSPSRNL